MPLPEAFPFDVSPLPNGGCATGVEGFSSGDTGFEGFSDGVDGFTSDGVGSFTSAFSPGGELVSQGGPTVTGSSERGACRRCSGSASLVAGVRRLRRRVRSRSSRASRSLMRRESAWSRSAAGIRSRGERFRLSRYVCSAKARRVVSEGLPGLLVSFASRLSALKASTSRRGGASLRPVMRVLFTTFT